LAWPLAARVTYLLDAKEMVIVTVVAVGAPRR